MAHITLPLRLGASGLILAQRYEVSKGNDALAGLVLEAKKTMRYSRLPFSSCACLLAFVKFAVDMFERGV